MCEGIVIFAVIELGVLPRLAAHILSEQTAEALARLRTVTEEVWEARGASAPCAFSAVWLLVLSALVLLQ